MSNINVNCGLGVVSDPQNHIYINIVGIGIGKHAENIETDYTNAQNIDKETYSGHMYIILNVRIY